MTRGRGRASCDGMKRIPSKDELRAFIAENPGTTAKRDIARAFGIKGAARTELKHALRELEAEGHVERRRRSFRHPDRLPPVTILRVTGPDDAGDLFARPMEWRGEGREPRILVIPRPGDPALAEGDRILAKLLPVHEADHQYEARLIRRIGLTPRRILGIFRAETEGGRIVPVDKGADKEWRVAAGATHGAEDGELVEAEAAGPPRLGLPKARITERLGDPSAPKSVSLIAIHQHGIPDAFTDAALAEAEAAEPAPLEGRDDLRALPFITIDPADARDHDDAVLAMPDDDAKNPGGHIVWVAIADVAHYVRPGSALDRDAQMRGNSTYFPDRVVPMLPERLSADLCSLVEGADRPVIALRMVLNAHGAKIAHRFTRAVLRIRTGLSYGEFQTAADESAEPLGEPIVGPLFAAYRAAARAREARQPLDLDLPERRIELAPDGRVVSVNFRERLEAHRLIEEFMVLANVCAAEELIARRQPLVFRVHEEPNPEKIEALREVAAASGLALAKGQVLHTRALNRLLAQAEGSEVDELINMATLRAMAQAHYNPENFGHFGLALRTYAHFTSPIRRYADLIVHRALISAHGWGDDGLDEAEIARLAETAKHISETERRSMAAERDTADRYLAAFLAERVGGEFEGRVSGVTRFGLFVRLAETGADGLVPIRSLGHEFFHFDADAQTLMGADTGLTIGLGDRVRVRLAEADPVTGGLLVELIELDGTAVARGPKPERGRRRRPGPPGKPAGKGRAKPATRKVTRRR